MLQLNQVFKNHAHIYCICGLYCVCYPVHLHQSQLPKLSPDAVIIAFGDSLTYATGVRPDISYPSILSTLTAHSVINAGVPGEVRKLGLTRLPGLLDDVQSELIHHLPCSQ